MPGDALRRQALPLLLCCATVAAKGTYQKLVDGSSLRLSDWGILGPFIIGKNELDGDPLEAEEGGAAAVALEYFSKTKPRRFRSELASLGWVQWQKASVSQDGFVSIQYPRIDWQGLVNSVSGHEILEHQTLAVSGFQISVSKTTVTTSCAGVATYFIEDRKGNTFGPFAGNPYSNAIGPKNALILKKGNYILRTRARVKHGGGFMCDIRLGQEAKLPKPESKFVPDWIDGLGPFGNRFIFALSIQNPSAARWLEVNLQVDDRSPFILKSFRGAAVVAPSQVASVGVELLPKDKACPNTFNVKVILTPVNADGSMEAGITNSIPLTPRCRDRGSSVLFSFWDGDGSVQQAAVVHPPKDECKNQCPVLITLHGTSITASNSADAYKVMPKGETSYTFGYAKGWLLAPSRHGAHNWEGIGRRHAIAALDALQEYSRVSDAAADINSLVVAGHSMGGHGAWLFAALESGRSLCLNANAGWLRKESYGDSNTLFMHDSRLDMVDPRLKHILEASIVENQVDMHVMNLVTMPVLARVGADDNTVHPWYTRRMVRLLNANGGNVTYSEPAGKEHWWWDTKVSNDGGAVNDRKLRKFFEDCAHRSNSLIEGDAFALTTFNPASTGSMRGVKIQQQVVPYQRSTVHVQTTGGKLIFSTINVKQIKLDKALLHYVNIEIDGQLLIQSSVSNDDFALICKQESLGIIQSWVYCSNSHAERRPENYGPLRQVLESKFIIVYVDGDDRQLRQAIYLANLFQVTGDGMVQITSDSTSYADFEQTEGNAIFIGGLSRNKWAAHFIESESIAVKVNEDGIRIGPCHFHGEGLGIAALLPFKPVDSIAATRTGLILDGSDYNGILDVVMLGAPTIPPMVRQPFSNTLPDYIVTSPSIRFAGAGGVLAAGFWGNEWEWRQDTGFAQSCIATSQSAD